jgi:hypothetical protein
MDPLEQQIAHAVNVDPSPEFVARVRARAATEPVIDRARHWPLAAAGLAAALGVAVCVQHSDRERTANSVAAVAVVHQAPRLPSPPAVVERVEPARVPIARRQARNTPEVIVAADEVRGLHALYDLMRNGHALIFEDNTDREPIDAPSLRAIVVAPIQIAPIALASTVTEGVEQ